MKDWQYTIEQAQAIKNGDMEARNRFYFDNLDHLEIMARAYVSLCRAQNGNRVCQVDELVQQVYLDLPLLNYDSLAKLTFSVKKRSFYLCAFGGWSYFVETGRSSTDYDRFSGSPLSLESMTDSDRPLMDFLVSSPSAEDEYEREEHQKVDSSVALRVVFDKYLAKRQADFLSLWCEGYSDSESARKIGTTIYNVHKKKALDRLRVNYSDVVDVLCENNCDTAFEYIFSIPALLEQSLKALTNTPEQKARAAENMRRHRAAKKAGTLLPAA